MKFESIIGRTGSYIVFQFEEHNTYSVNCGDQIWSDGFTVEISEDIDKEDLDFFVSLVDNKTSFKEALRRVGFYE